MSFKGLARIVVFGAEYCGFCKRAHSLLSKANTKFSYLDVDEENALEMLQTLQRKHSYYKIPMIFVD